MKNSRAGGPGGPVIVTDGSELAGLASGQYAGRCPGPRPGPARLVPTDTTQEQAAPGRAQWTLSALAAKLSEAGM